MIPMPTQANVVPRAPQTQLRLYRGVPWDNSYNHVRLYNSTQDLLNHLEHWRVNLSSGLDEMSPIRVGSLDVKVPFTEMSALDLNYLAFNNYGLHDEWVFCFITSIEWRSERTTRIIFELDVFQCNWYKLNVKPCFIEYHHIPKSQDSIGANQIPVNLESGESVVANSYLYPLYNMDICVYVSEGTTGEPFDGSVVNGIYRTGSLGHYSVKDVETVNNLIKQYTEEGIVDDIMAIFMAPQICINAIKGDDSNRAKFKLPLNKGDIFGGYIPRNKKLYSYPFCYAMVDNNEGQANVYRFELSNNADHSIDFEIVGAMCTLPQVLVSPLNYKGVNHLFSESLVISGFPQCAFQSDTFKAWVAQNKGALAVQATSIVTDSLQAPVGAVTAVATGGASAVLGGMQATSSSVSAIQGTMSLLAQLRDKSVVPASVHGKALSENVNVACALTGFTFYVMSCQEEFARVIDSFFDVYGYPVNRVAMPNIHTRSTWNYVKTAGCGFTGAVDLAQLQQIRAIFNRGVTLWHTDDIGNYSLQNN